MANFVCLAAARHKVLSEADWDVETKGLVGSPRIEITVGEKPMPPSNPPFAI